MAGSLGYAAGYATCILLALARAAEFAGRWHVPARDDVHTANADIAAGWSGAGLVSFVIVTGPMVTALALLTGWLLD
ncbi:hypothetical protein AB0F81_22530 [Actinoplanes sp. NPDC024001]|uniref:hypothetical protein n=1 Tax=Actinoplanes sp. NPDC024001 TaxID=3154598 RepID=UPI003400A659